jgi:hypothetical protein
VTLLDQSNGQALCGGAFPLFHRRSGMTTTELRRKLRGVETGGLFFRLLTCF